MDENLSRAGLDLVSFLEKICGLSVISSQTFPSFGDKILVLQGQGVLVRFLRDRGDWFVEVSATSDPDEWYDVALLKEHITKLVGADVLPFDEQASYLRTNWVVVHQSLVGARAETARADLRLRRQQRVKRRFPDALG